MMKTRASPGSHERTKENLCCSEKTSLEPGLGVRGLNVRGKLEAKGTACAHKGCSKEVCIYGKMERKVREDRLGL